MTQHADIQQRILDDIVSGTFSPGSRLTIDDLANRYGASHMPVREALRVLQGAGLLEKGPGRSACVRDLDADVVENVFATHVALQVMLVRKAAQNCTPHQLDSLQKTERDLEACITKDDYDGALRENRRFHDALNAIADNPDATAALNRQWMLLITLWRHVGYAPQRLAGVADDHRHLLRALAHRDAEAAGLLIGAHVVKAKFELFDQMAKRALNRPGTAA